ncbi:MAG: transposase [Cloacibacterium normanense]
MVLTNEFELSAKEIADYYRKRWDIEVFLDS